jgi:putative ABC transport system permease protein
MKIPLMRGRYFDDRDTADSVNVVILDETMARKYWPDEDPLHKRITLDNDEKGQPRYREIVGIVSHVRHRGLEGESRTQYYLPHTQTANPNMFFAIRTQGEPTTLAGAARGVIRGLDQDLPLFRVTAMEQIVAESLAQRRFALTLFGIFAAVALALAAVGLYGVLSYSVTQRTHEIGLRMALGAQGGDVVRMVLRQGMLLALMGVALGIAGAFLLLRLMERLLYGVTPRDPLTFAAIAGLLTLIALLACFIPARRATKVDPLIALRCE